MKICGVLFLGVVYGSSVEHPETNESNKLGVLERLERSFIGKRGRDLEDTITSVTSLLQRQRDGASDVGQKFAARLEQLLDTAKAQYEESSGPSVSEGEQEATKAEETTTVAETVDEKIGKGLGAALSRFEKSAGERFGGEGQVRDALGGLETGIRNRVEGGGPAGGSRVLLGGERLSGIALRGDDAAGRHSVGADGEGPSIELRADGGVVGLAEGIREAAKPSGRPSVGGVGEGPSVLSGDGAKAYIDGLKGNHTLNFGGLDERGGPSVLGGDGGKPSLGGLKGNHTLNFGGLDRDGDMGGWLGGCERLSTTSTTTATTTGTSTLTTTSTVLPQTPPGGRRLLPEGIGGGLLNGGAHSDDDHHHSDDSEWAMSTTPTDVPRTYDAVEYVADMLNKTAEWVLVQWPESKTGVKFPVRLLNKQRNAMPVEDIVLLYILRNGGVSEHVMTYFDNRTADEFMRSPSDAFVEKYEEFVNLLDMLWDLFQLTAPPNPTTTTSTAVTTWEHGTTHKATTGPATSISATSTSAAAALATTTSTWTTTTTTTAVATTATPTTTTATLTTTTATPTTTTATPTTTTATPTTTTATLA